MRGKANCPEGTQKVGGEVLKVSRLEGVWRATRSITGRIAKCWRRQMGQPCLTQGAVTLTPICSVSGGAHNTGIFL